MPKPTPNETKDDFLNRCMGDEKALNDFPENDQRFAVCNSLWDESRMTALSKYMEAFAEKTYSDYPDSVRNNARRGIELNKELGNKCATQVGKVAQKAAGAASRLGEGKEQLQEKPGDGYLGPTPIPNPIRLAKDTVDATNRATQKRVDAVNAVLPGSASMPKNVTYFNKGPSAASQKYLGLKNSYEPDANLVDEQNAGPSTPVKFDSHMGQLVPNQGAGRVGAVRLKPGMGLKKGGTVKKEQVSFEIGSGDPNAARKQQKINKAADVGVPNAAAKAKGPLLPSSMVKLANSYEPEDIYDLVMEYLLQTEQAETISEAQYIMSQMDIEMIQSIVEQLTPLGVKTAGVVDDQRRGSTMAKDLKGTRDALDKMKPYPKGFPGV